MSSSVSLDQLKRYLATVPDRYAQGRMPGSLSAASQARLANSRNARDLAAEKKKLLENQKLLDTVDGLQSPPQPVKHAVNRADTTSPDSSFTSNSSFQQRRRAVSRDQFATMFSGAEKHDRTGNRWWSARINTPPVAHRTLSKSAGLPRSQSVPGRLRPARKPSDEEPSSDTKSTVLAVAGTATPKARESITVPVAPKPQGLMRREQSKSRVLPVVPCAMVDISDTANSCRSRSVPSQQVLRATARVHEAIERGALRWDRAPRRAESDGMCTSDSTPSVPIGDSAPSVSIYLLIADSAPAPSVAPVRSNPSRTPEKLVKSPRANETQTSPAAAAPMDASRRSATAHGPLLTEGSALWSRSLRYEPEPRHAPTPPRMRRPPARSSSSR